MLRSPGERGERGLAIFLESLKLPAAVGMKVRRCFTKFEGREWGEGTINQVAFRPQVFSSKKKQEKKRRKKQGFSSPNFLRKESGS